jgi:shikimate kinase
MKILGEGEARGGVSILHALGTGKGCSVGVNLLTSVRLVDKKTENLQDKHDLLDSVIKCWESEGLPLPKEYGWNISSEVPIGQGLKSSSALACAAIKSLNSAMWMNLNNFEIVDLAVKAQKGAGCTVTGSIDDTWCTMTEGWKLVDSSKNAAESVLSEGRIKDSLYVLIAMRGNRRKEIHIDSFIKYDALFEKALKSVEKGDIFGALTTNGMAVAAAKDDSEAIKICNLSIVNGAIAAGLTGSGPAICIICYEKEIRILSDLLKSHNMDFMKTTFYNFSNKEGVKWE